MTQFVAHSIKVIKTNQLMLYKEISAIYSENHTKRTNALCRQTQNLLMFKTLLYTQEPLRFTGLIIFGGNWRAMTSYITESLGLACSHLHDQGH
jgi:hypothetical protein